MEAREDDSEQIDGWRAWGTMALLCGTTTGCLGLVIGALQYHQSPADGFNWLAPIVGVALGIAYGSGSVLLE